MPMQLSLRNSYSSCHLYARPSCAAPAACSAAGTIRSVHDDRLGLFRVNAIPKAPARPGGHAADDLDADDLFLLDDLLSGFAPPPASGSWDAEGGGQAQPAAPRLTRSALRPWERPPPQAEPEPPGVQPEAGTKGQKPESGQKIVHPRLRRPQPRPRLVLKPATTPAAALGAAQNLPPRTSPSTSLPRPAAPSASAQPELRPRPQLPGVFQQLAKARSLSAAQPSTPPPAAQPAASPAQPSPAKPAWTAAESWFAQDPVFQAAQDAAARSILLASTSGDDTRGSLASPLARAQSLPGAAFSSPLLDLLDPLPLIQLQPFDSSTSEPWRPGTQPGGLPEFSSAASLVPSEALPQGSFVPSTRSRRQRRADPSESEQLKAALAQEIAAAASPASQSSQQRKQSGPGSSQQGWQPLLMPQVTPESLAGRAGAAATALPSLQDLPAHVDASNWRVHAQVRFPKVYDATWHSTLYEFLSDLWTAVGKAHEAQSSTFRGTGTPSASNRVAQQELLQQAYVFADVCWRTTDSRFKVSTVLALADTVVVFESMFEDCVKLLPPDMVAKGVLPLIKLMHPEEFVAHLSLARAHFGQGWPKTLTPPKGLASLVSRLKALKVCHPEVDLGVLAYMDAACNLE